MNNCLRHIALILLAIFGPLLTVAKEPAATPFLEASLRKDKVVEGERVIYEVSLLTPDPEVAGFEVLRYPDLNNLPADRASADNRLEEVRRNGKDYYSVVIDRYFIGADEVGKHLLKGGDYRVGFTRRVRVHDPFWGPTIQNRVEVLDLSAPDLALSVKQLPSKGKPEDFSGAVGVFDIRLELPKGELRAGQDMLAIVTLEGRGDLTNTPAPDVRQAFREGLHFRNMTDEKQNFVSADGLGSEMVLVCRFTADAPGEYTILPVRFSYYDQEKGRYTTISTKPVTIQVTSGSRNDGKPPVIMEV